MCEHCGATPYCQMCDEETEVLLFIDGIGYSLCGDHATALIERTNMMRATAPLN